MANTILISLLGTFIMLGITLLLSRLYQKQRLNKVLETDKSGKLFDNTSGMEEEFYARHDMITNEVVDKN